LGSGGGGGGGTKTRGQLLLASDSYIEKSTNQIKTKQINLPWNKIFKMSSKRRAHGYYYFKDYKGHLSISRQRRYLTKKVIN